MEKGASLPCTVREGTWDDFREDVKRVNMELFNAIEKISPDKSLTLLELTYRYGEYITSLGRICLPNKNGKLKPLDDASVDNRYRSQLDYCPTPLILQLEKSAEVFVDTGERIVPLNVFVPGDLYGLFETIMPLTQCPIYPCWSVTSGGRSVFLAPKVGDNIGHQRLRKAYGVMHEAPKNLLVQWDIFKKIIYQESKEKPWCSRILIFTKKWLEQPHEDSVGWLSFHNYLLKKSWFQSRFMRMKTELAIMWESFARFIREKRLKPSAYILDTLMHNIFLTNGAVPGFRPATTDELLLPNKLIEDAYENVYQLKEYPPTIMHPYRLSSTGSDSVLYYSMAYPTMLEGSTMIRRHPSVIAELRDVKLLMRALQQVVREQKTPIKLAEHARFNYYHSEEDALEDIKSTKTLLKEDLSFQKNLLRFSCHQFPHKAPFFRGCIQIISNTV